MALHYLNATEDRFSVIPAFAGMTEGQFPIIF
ncbi:MAG: hypothetical protein QG656_2254 [Candidatus Hydrogenedentes bacterium]|nr:hypothetical protein [Candidatus Hydrogenedentota bacterium]